MSVADLTIHTPDDLLAMPDGDRYELVDGQLVERNMSADSSWIAGELFGRLRDHVQLQQLGWAFPEGTGFQCFADDPGRVRKADASFVGRGRLPAGTGPGWLKVAPDLAIEVVSPHDQAYDVAVKVDEWLAAGVQEVWVVMPANETLTVQTAAGELLRLTADESLADREVLPGFSFRVGDIFPDWS